MHRTAILLLSLVLVALVGCGGDAPDTADEAAPAAASDAATSTDAAPADPAATDAADGALVNPNEAPESALLEVPGMTGEIVAAVMAGRPWSDMTAVDAALAEAGLDEAAREEAYRVMFLPLDLNTASEEEIMLIPGVGSRMAHEFEEYRPYDAMARFRAEIGKYVDEAEVARLERYVVIR